MNNKPQLKSFVITIVISSIILGAIAGGLTGTLSWMFVSNRFGLADNAAQSGRTTADDSGARLVSQSEVALEEQTVQVVDDALPAVVSVIATQELQLLPQSGFFNDFFFSFPFGPFGTQPAPQDQPQPQTERREVSSGSGFIVDQSGLVVTNKHVVSNSKAEYSIVMSDGQTYEAEVLDRDAVEDLAVLQIKTDAEIDFPTLTLGNSDEVKIGQTVLAIGNTLGEFRNTVTRGIVSGINRTLTAGGVGVGGELIEGAIQTDAAISSGNSGGPLLNLQGQVIGVNTAVSEQGENIGFALPVDQVKLIVASIKEHGKIVRPFLGVRYILLNEQIAEKNGMDQTAGALIIRGDTMEDLAVVPGSPADKAGLRENDIILEVDGRKISQNQSLQRILLNYQVGDPVTLKIYRAGDIIEKEVELVDRGEF